MRARRCLTMTTLAGLTALAVSSAATPAAAGDTPTEIRMVIEHHRFRPDEIRVKPGAPFVLIITNKDNEEEEFECEVLKVERAIPPGKTTRVRFRGAAGRHLRVRGRESPERGQRADRRGVSGLTGSPPGARKPLEGAEDQAEWPGPSGGQRPAPRAARPRASNARRDLVARSLSCSTCFGFSPSYSAATAGSPSRTWPCATSSPSTSGR